MSDIEISDFMKSYSRAFRPGNAKGMKCFYAYPTTMLTNGMKLVFENAEETSSAISAGLETLANNGFSHSELQELHIHKLATDVAIVSATYNRLRTDGSVLENIAATYNLFKENEGSWKILLTTTHNNDGLLRND